MLLSIAMLASFLGGASAPGPVDEVECTGCAATVFLGATTFPDAPAGVTINLSASFDPVESGTCSYDSMGQSCITGSSCGFGWTVTAEVIGASAGQLTHGGALNAPGGSIRIYNDEDVSGGYYFEEQSLTIEPLCATQYTYTALIRNAATGTTAARNVSWARCGQCFETP